MKTETIIKTVAALAVACSGLLADLEGQLQRQKGFVRWLHEISALQHIIEGAQCEQSKLEAAVESERCRSANDELKHRRE